MFSIYMYIIVINFNGLSALSSLCGNRYNALGGLCMIVVVNQSMLVKEPNMISHLRIIILRKSVPE